MADRNYDSAGSGAYTTLATALAAVAASDEIILAKSTSVETLGANTTYTAPAAYALAGKAQRLFSVDDFTTPDLTTGAIIDWTGSYALTFEGNWHLSGITFGYSAGSSSTAGSTSFGTGNVPGVVIADNCTFRNLSTSTSPGPSPLSLGPLGSPNNDAYTNYFNNCTLEFGHLNHGINVRNGIHNLNNLILGGTVTPLSLFKMVAGTGVSILRIKNSDLSTKSWTNLLSINANSQLEVFLENCKMPASFNWYLGTPHIGTNITAVNCTSGDNGISYYKLDGAAGTVQTDASIYASTDPISDGGTPVSYLMTSFSSCGRSCGLSQEFKVEVGTDTSVTPYIEVLVQGTGATPLKTTELYIEVESLAIDGSSLGVVYTTFPGLLNPGATDCSAGTIGYTNDGYPSETTHRLSIASFTTRQDGFVKITVHLTKPSVAIYVGQYGI
jgi:hypothetical protein